MLDDLITEKGEDGVLAMVCTRIAEGEDPRRIAVNNGMPWMVLRKWLEDSPGRMKEWELAKRCFADGLVYEGLKEVRDCGLEEVPLAKLRSESYGKVAAKLSRVEWGDKQETVTGFGAGGITIVIGEVKSPYLEVEKPAGALVVQGECS